MKNASVDKEIGSRIRKARSELGKTQENLAQEIGVQSSQIISEIEQGERAVKASEINKLAQALFKDPVYFLTPENPGEQPVVLCRGAKLCEVGNLAASGAYFIQKCEQYHHVETILNDKPSQQLNQVEISVKFTRDDYSWANNLGNSTRNTFQLGARPARVLNSILEQNFNVKIWYRPGIDDGSACATIGNFGAGILIDSTDAPWRRNFDLAHELFHLLTWESFAKQEGRDETWHSRVEKLAEIFASSLLLPEEEVRTEFASRISDDRISYIDLINIARDFDVSTSALLWRLVVLKCLKEDDVAEALKDDYFRKQDKSERVGQWLQAREFPERFVKLAVTAYNLGELSKGQLARYLETSIAEVADKTQEYGYPLEVLNGREATTSFRC